MIMMIMTTMMVMMIMTVLMRMSVRGAGTGQGRGEGGGGGVVPSLNDGNKTKISRLAPGKTNSPKTHPSPKRWRVSNPDPSFPFPQQPRSASHPYTSLTRAHWCC